MFISRDCQRRVLCHRVSATGASFQAHVLAARRLTFAGTRLVSVPPCLRPIEEETTTASSSRDVTSFSDDELSGISDVSHDYDTGAQAATRRFDDISLTDFSFHERKYILHNNNDDDDDDNNNNNKCVSRTDTNPPFAFQIAFPRGTDFTGFLQGGSKSYIRCV